MVGEQGAERMEVGGLVRKKLSMNFACQVFKNNGHVEKIGNLSHLNIDNIHILNPFVSTNVRF